MKSFKDLTFKPHQMGEGIQAHYVFDNDYEISVAAGKFCYSTPKAEVPLGAYTAFEVAIFNSDGDFCTGELCASTDDVVGWCSRTDIDNLMEIAQEQ